MTNNVDLSLEGGSIDFQKALAYSMVSAEHPEKATVVTSAILFTYSRVARPDRAVCLKRDPWAQLATDRSCD